MMQMNLLDGVPVRRRRSGLEAQQRKRNGQFKAADKAGSAWMADMLEELRRWLAALPAGHGEAFAHGVTKAPKLFTFEEFRCHCEERGLPPPASLNAWGALPSSATRDDLCRWTGQAVPAKRPESHGRLVKLWEVR